MRAQRIKREGAEQIFITVKNGEARRLIPGEPVCFDMVTDKDGGTVVAPATTSVNFTAGAVVKTIGTSGNNDQYGEIQVYGYITTLRVMVGASLYPGDYLKMVAGTSCFNSAVFAATTIGTEAEIKALKQAIAIAGTTIGSSTYAQEICGFVKAL